MADINKPDELSSLDKFKRRLDRRGGRQSDFKSTLLPTKDFKVNKSWDDDEFTAVDYRPAVAKKTNRFLWYLFLGSALFFLATMAVAVYVLFFSSNIVSGNNIDLLITGPAQIRSGDEVDLQTAIVNKNKVVLNNVNLVITYPSGTMDSLSPNTGLPMWREKINDLNPGQTINIASRAVVFGGQNTTQTIKIVMEYHIPDSNALFTKEKDYIVTIGSSSLNLNLNLPTEINVGKEFTSTLKIVSNAQSLLRNCTIKFTWPAGFTFKTSDPAPVSGNDTWFLGDLVPGTEKEINFTGTLAGQSGDAKSFKVSAGLATNGGQDQMSLEYGDLFQTVNLRKDLVSAGIAVADQYGHDPIIYPGGNVKGNLGWLNNLNDEVIDGTVQLELSGDSIDKRQVQAGNGFYDSNSNTLSWDERSLADLRSIAPSSGGQANFVIGILPLSSGSVAHNSEINLKLTWRGTHVIGSNQTEDVVTEAIKTLKISTLANLVADGVYHLGPFTNTGPLPPTVGQETTYTVNWTVTNTINDLNNVMVRTILPPSVKWLGAVSPLDEKVSYNQTSGEVVWNLGKVTAGTGGESPARHVSFQISLLPSLSQLTTSPGLTGNVEMSGQDAFTGATISQSVPPITTIISADPNFVQGQDKVVAQ